MIFFYTYFETTARMLDHFHSLLTGGWVCKNFKTSCLQDGFFLGRVVKLTQSDRPFSDF